MHVLNGLGQLVLGGLHERRVESTTHIEHQGALCTGGLHLLAGLVDTIDRARDDQLARAVVVGGDDHLAALRHLFANFLHLGVLQADDGGHGARILLASLLHGIGTGGHQLQTVLESQGTRDDEGRELTEGVAGHHALLEVLVEAGGSDHAVEEDGGLRHLGLLQLLVGASEHDGSDIET